MPSKFNARQFFLTYPKCDAPKEYLRDILIKQCSIKHLVVCREQHEDGSLHLHAAVWYTKVMHCNERFFDFMWNKEDGTDEERARVFHPNIQVPKKWPAVVQYCKKGEDFLEVDVNLDGFKVESNEEVGEMSIQEKCFSFDKEEDWFEHCAIEKISFQYAQYFWNRLHGDLCTILDDEHEGDVCSALDSFSLPGNPRFSLVLRGPSGCGKTTWAKRNAPKPCLFVSHVDQLKLFRQGYHKSIVFDDVSFCHTPRTNQIALVDCDNTRAIHCRHAVATIPAGIIKIFTCNEWPVDKQDEAISRRCKFYTIRDWGQLINPE